MAWLGILHRNMEAFRNDEPSRSEVGVPMTNFTEEWTWKIDENWSACLVPHGYPWFSALPFYRILPVDPSFGVFVQDKLSCFANAIRLSENLLVERVFTADANGSHWITLLAALILKASPSNLYSNLEFTTSFRSRMTPEVPDDLGCVPHLDPIFRLETPNVRICHILSKDLFSTSPLPSPRFPSPHCRSSNHKSTCNIYVFSF